ALGHLQTERTELVPVVLLCSGFHIFVRTSEYSDKELVSDDLIPVFAWNCSHFPLVAVSKNFRCAERGEGYAKK
ncbi:MAG TPA: hypothetical protein VM870_05530, partial [Pyrinomonadaceae bacterium]|nr:hypothetical protein [Pyrinomonadaceae bacterium]